MNLATFAALAALLFAPGAFAINRCTVDGQTVFQDAPCPGSLGTVGDDLRAKEAARIEQAARERANKQRDAELAEATRQRAAQEATRQEQLNPCAPGYDGRVAEYLRKNPQMKASLDQVARSGEAFIGMPEAFVHVLACEAIETTNTTQTASGSSKQIVMRSIGILGAKLIYTRNGVVYALQS